MPPTTRSKMYQSCVLLCLLGMTVVLPFASCSACSSALGMEDDKIKDSQITVSSVLRNTATGEKARLRKNIKPWGAWCPNITRGSNTGTNFDQYIQIDLLNLKKVTRIATQGREHNQGKEFVSEYKISYSSDGETWFYYKKTDQLNEAKLFIGNFNVRSVKNNSLEPVIIARYIRIHPGYKQNYVCMRLEVYGCELDENDKVPGNKDEKLSLQECSCDGITYLSCSGTQSASQVLPSMTSTTQRPGGEVKTKTSIVTIVVGVGLALSIVLNVLFGTLIYKLKRRHGAPKFISTSVSIPMQNDLVEEQTENNQESDDEVEARNPTAPYEEVHIYTELDKKKLDKGEGNYQQLLKPDSDYVIPADDDGESYEDVQIVKNTPGYKELNNTKREQEDISSYQKLIKK